MSDTIPGVISVFYKRLNREAVIVFSSHKYTSGIAIFLVTQTLFLGGGNYLVSAASLHEGSGKMWIQGSWYYTREIWTALIRSGELAVPGTIPGGMARGLNSRDEWLDPQQGANCSREDSGCYSVSSHTSGAAIRGGVVDLFVYTRAGRLLCL